MPVLRRNGCAWVGGAIVLVLAVAVGVTVYAVATWDPRGSYVKDARACPKSNVELGDITRHFQITMPSDATDVHFSSDLHPLFGEYHLKLSFRATESGLQTFLDASKLSSPRQPASSAVPTAVPTADPSAVPSADPSCGFDPASFHRPRHYGDVDQARSSTEFVREVMVDGADRTHPRVVVTASDL